MFAYETALTRRAVGRGNTFEVASGFVAACDPCYAREEWPAHRVTPMQAVNGTWHSDVTMDDDDTIITLQAVHHAHRHRKDWTLLKDKIGVDSGQAGIYDVATFPESKGSYGDLSTFYDRVCHLTLSGSGWGVLDSGGVVCRSGYGDGYYPLYALLDGEHVVGLKTQFDGEIIEHNPIRPGHPLWDTFVARLSGPEGCDFRQDEHGREVWDCDRGGDDSFAEAILQDMGFTDNAILLSLAYFQDNGGYCDCEIILNVAGR